MPTKPDPEDKNKKSQIDPELHGGFMFEWWIGSGIAVRHPHIGVK